jgi:ATP-dependent DNA ligase
MLATLTDAPFDDPSWVFEDKYDGFRMIAEIRRARLRSTAATARSSAAAIWKSPRRWKA